MPIFPPWLPSPPILLSTLGIPPITTRISFCNLMEPLFAPYTRGHLTFVDSLCIPLASCPDAAHAEAAAAAGAVQLAAKHFPRLSPTRIVIKGDNKAVIDFMTNTGNNRRPDLQQSLQEAHHLLAFRLPPCYWCYTPREFNKCADYLAGVARDHARNASLPQHPHSSP